MISLRILLKAEAPDAKGHPSACCGGLHCPKLQKKGGAERPCSTTHPFAPIGPCAKPSLARGSFLAPLILDHHLLDVEVLSQFQARFRVSPLTLFARLLPYPACSPSRYSTVAIWDAICNYFVPNGYIAATNSLTRIEDPNSPTFLSGAERLSLHPRTIFRYD